ncbi:unnamed protein product, partial [marine sediment metagenome]
MKEEFAKQALVALTSVLGSDLYFNIQILKVFQV